MIYLMIYSKLCGHLYVFNYQHRVSRTGLALCRCNS